MIRFLEGLAAPSRTKGGDNRSVMPLDVRGCTRATLKASACALSVPCLKRLGNPLNRLRAWDRDLQLSPLNEEFPVGASHQGDIHMDNKKLLRGFFKNLLKGFL